MGLAMQPLLEITVIHGYGPISHGVRENARAVAELLRELGIPVDYTEVTIPALDIEDSFEPIVFVNNVEVYLPSVRADVEKLADYLLAMVGGAAGVGVAGFPLPPVANIAA
ncbi:hypothetical protein Pyrde_1104 [Pyrodictium delaneyi]|uniref:Uncharacterized protein n=2 Tax=Pyrodictium delaneyi TaxID=1273541 RepID=A0A0P0N4I4_9CREN|nr:hypothetical protein Pyrde_1104 [Pyrodictium delaneyi]OWJ55273.1 hypothetical protein Pdsh_00120 [Pyrodictium delaneyi]